MGKQMGPTGCAAPVLSIFPKVPFRRISGYAGSVRAAERQNFSTSANVRAYLQ